MTKQKMTLAELRDKILSFGVNYTEKQKRLENKGSEYNNLNYAYYAGFINALSLVMEDLEKIEQ
jgi:hypothetical protein